MNSFDLRNVLEVKEFDTTRSVVFGSLNIILSIFGLFANLGVIFVILALQDYKKSVTHWYILQLAFADTLFLFTQPFIAAEYLNFSWNYSIGWCKAVQSILFINYFASVLFLMIMSIDRYLAVCFPVSNTVQNLRKPRIAYIASAVAWLIAIFLSVPVMLYSDVKGTEPFCTCRIDFPQTRFGSDRCREDLRNNEIPEAIIAFCNTLDLACIPQDMKLSLNESDAPIEIFDFKNEPGFNPETTNGSNKEFNQAPPNYSDLDPSQLLTQFSNSGDGSKFDLKNEPGFNPETTNGSNKEFNQVPPNYSDLDYSEVLTQLFNFSDGSSIPAECTYINSSEGWIIFLWVAFGAFFILPTLIMTIFYGLIIHRLTQIPKSTSTVSKVYKERKRITFMCCILVGSFVCCRIIFYSNHIGKILVIRNLTKEGCKILGDVGLLLSYLSSALNPYLYTFLGSGIKRKLESLKTTPTVQQIIALTSRTGPTKNFMTKTQGKSSDKVTNLAQVDEKHSDGTAKVAASLGSTS